MSEMNEEALDVQRYEAEVTLIGEPVRICSAQEWYDQQDLDEEAMWKARVNGTATLAGICETLGISQPEGEKRFWAWVDEQVTQ